MEFQDALIGAGIGSIVGKAIVHRAEKRGGELPAWRVRQLEVTWVCVGLGIAGVVSLGARLT